MGDAAKPPHAMPPHRDAGDDPREFASRFIEARMRGFEKDMGICLTPVDSKERSGKTHAYFPALMNCCATLEYLAGLHVGRLKSCGHPELRSYAKFLPQPDYNDDNLYVLFEAFRHPVAHRGIASGVWVDQHNERPERRVTWRIGADPRGPALEVRAVTGALKRDTPWECRFTHRAYIHLGRLWRDIRDSAVGPTGYREALRSDPALLRNFMRCMERLYPR